MSLAKSLQKGLLVAAAAMLVATPVLAQEPAPASQPAAAPVAAAAPAAPTPAYGEAQMRSFARATVDLQLVDPRDVSGQARAIEAAGMSVEQYNQMGDAMRGDPQLAARLNPYLANARAERPAIPGYTPNAYARSYSSSYRPAVHHTSSRASKSHARKGKASRASRRGHKAASSRHARSTSHKKTTAHHSTTHRKRHR
ncbi:DUF4168 domain-containing protein [Phenylobacterium soli]|nr:DUF4168 domain-containing protein [Phenylobacterium soli]